MVSCTHTKLCQPSSMFAADPSSSGSTWQAVEWKTTALHMLLGESAGLVLGPVPWSGYENLQELCVAAAVKLAGANKQLALLDGCVNQDGEELYYISYRCRVAHRAIGNPVPAYSTTLVATGVLL